MTRLMRPHLIQLIKASQKIEVEYDLYKYDLPPSLPSTDYIAFTDDITQITSGPYKFKHSTNHKTRSTKNQHL